MRVLGFVFIFIISCYFWLFYDIPATLVIFPLAIIGLSGGFLVYCLFILTSRKNMASVTNRISSFPQIEIMKTMPKAFIGVGPELVIGKKLYTITEGELVGCLGRHYSGQTRIIIDGKVNKNNLENYGVIWDKVFIHEAIHGINSQYLDETLKEPEIEAIGYGVWQILRQLGVRLTP